MKTPGILMLSIMETAMQIPPVHLLAGGSTRPFTYLTFQRCIKTDRVILGSINQMNGADIKTCPDLSMGKKSP